MNRFRHFLLSMATAGAVVFVFSPLGAQTLDGAQFVQMMHGDKGMQGQGTQMQTGQGPPPMQGQGMGEHGMKGQQTQAPPQPLVPGMQGQSGQNQVGGMGTMGTSGTPTMGCSMCATSGSDAAAMGQAGGAIMDNMQGGPRMMQMMMQPRMVVIPSDRIEGRIAYLHAELRITPAQMAAWNDVATVLRANAKRLSEARPAQPQKADRSVLERADEQERVLGARLESIRAIKPAYAKLHEALDDAQKKSADELMAPYLGLI